MTNRPAAFFVAALLLLGYAMAAFATSNGAWLRNVPQRDRERVNPYHGQPDAVAAGRRIFLDHCAHCHGKDAEGTKKRPSLRSLRVQQEATDGDLHWLLVNGNRSHGMPSWVKLGDPQIWQVICYVKSLHER
jgi:mono/diheme cytochrome c family protein